MIYLKDFVILRILLSYLFVTEQLVCYFDHIEVKTEDPTLFLCHPELVNLKDQNFKFIEKLVFF